MATPSLSFISGIPASGNNPSDDQPNMLINFNSTQSIIGVDHVGFNTQNSGYHNKVTLTGSVPSVPADPFSVVFANTTTGNNKPQLFHYNSVNSNQYTVGATNFSNGSTMLLGGIILKWAFINYGGGQNTLDYVANLGLQPFPNHIFSASISTSNVSIPGALKTLTTSTIQISTSGATGVYLLMIGN